MEQNLVEFLTKTLDDLKAQDILAIDVKGKSSITDAMIIATGTSVRHVASTADRLAQEAKQAGFEVFGDEGKAVADWIVVERNGVDYSVLQADAREMYQLEKLWA